jgi:TonB family protein
MQNAAWLATLVIFCRLLPQTVVLAQSQENPAIRAEVSKQLEAGKKALNRENFEKAIRAFSKANELSDDELIFAYIGLATAHLRLQQYQEALDYGSKSLEIAETPAEKAVAENMVGATLMEKHQITGVEQEDLEKAEAHFRAALDFSAGQLNIGWYNLAVVLEQQRRFEEAKVTLEEYLDRVTDSEVALSRLREIETELEVQQAIAGRKIYRVRTGDDVIPPEMIRARSPRYTDIARRNRVQGVVIIEAIINKEGKVLKVKILKGLPMGLNEAAADAGQKWRFAPATLNGKPVDVFYNLTVNFRLD